MYVLKFIKGQVLCFMLGVEAMYLLSLNEAKKLSKAIIKISSGSKDHDHVKI